MSWRPLVKRYYEVQTTVPVGDAPREADLVLVRRTTTGLPPFQGLWKDLTAWNMLEFKGPTVSPRVRDLDLLVELGLGIDRRLNEERVRQQQRPSVPDATSFWYLASRLGSRFLREARHRFADLEVHAQGVWHGTVVRRQLFLVSSSALPVDDDSVPLHLIGREPPETEIAVARLVVERPALWETYNPWLRALHPAAWKEVSGMAQAAKQKLQIDILALIEAAGVKPVIEAMGVKPVLDALRAKPGVEALGAKPVGQAVSVKQVVEAVVDEVGVDAILAHLTPAQRQELKRKLR